MRNATLILAFTLAAATSTQAQTAPSWEVSPGGAVSWVRVTSAGNVLACTTEGLKGLDPMTGKVQWTIAELAGAPEDGFEEIQGTPFVAMVPPNGANQLYIVEPFEGRVLFSSTAVGITNVADKYFLYEAGVIVVVGQQGKDPVMSCIDMATGQPRWSKTSGFSKLTSCTAIGTEEILLSTLFFAYKLNARTGDEIWKQSPDPKFAAMSGLMGMLDKGGANLGNSMELAGAFITTPHAPGLCFMALQQTKRSEKTGTDGKTTVTVSYESFYNAFNIGDGSYVWPKPLLYTHKLGAIVPVKEGLVIGGLGNGYANMIDYRAGTPAWGKNGKGITVKSGDLQNAIATGDKLLLVSGAENGAALLVHAGTSNEAWPKNVKLDGAIKKVVDLGNTLAIGSTEQVEVVDKSTGLSVIDGPFKGGSGLIAVQGDNTYLFNAKDGLLRSFDGSSARTLGTLPLKFEGKEIPTSLEVLPEGILLNSAQNIALLNTDGSITYQKHFPAARESGFKRALLYASAVRAAYYTAAFGYTSAAFGAVSSSIEVQNTEGAVAKEITGQLSAVYGDAAKMGLGATQEFLARANARFRATTTTQTTQIMLSEVASKEYVLLAVKKTDGSVASSIALGKNKTPQYAVDGVDNSVYLVAGEKVQAYR